MTLNGLSGNYCIEVTKFKRLVHFNDLEILHHYYHMIKLLLSKFTGFMKVNETKFNFKAKL